MRDKEIIRKRFEAGFEAYNLFATVQDAICEQLVSRLREQSIAAHEILEIGAGTGFLTRRLAVEYPAAAMTVNDLVESSRNYVSSHLCGDEQYRFGDAETIDLGSGYDLVASSSAIQWFEDIPTFFGKVWSILNDRGVFAFSSFGPQNFHEIMATTGEGLSYYSVSEMEEIIRRAGFEVLYITDYCEKMIFDTPKSVLKHIKQTGVNGLKHVAWTKSKLVDFEHVYCTKFRCEAGVELTYHPILVICRKKKL